MQTMKALIVDDDETFSRSLGFVVERQGWEVLRAGSVEEADETLLQNADIDLLILDRNLPLTSGMAPSEEFGDELMRQVRKSSFDGAVIGLTGFRDISQLEEALAEAPAALRIGESIVPRVEIMDKYLMDEFVRRLKTLSNHLSKLDDFTVFGPSLEKFEQRAVAHFGLGRGAIACEVWRFTGGKSGDSVLKIKASYEDGHSDLALLKVTNRKKSTDFSHALPNTVVAGKIGEIEGFMSRKHANVYPLVDGHIEMLELDPSTTICHTELGRVNGVIFERKGLGSPRRVTVREAFGAIGKFQQMEEQAELIGVGWPILEDSLSVKWGRCHGDLHAANILTDRDSQMVVIDLESSSEGSVAIDISALYFSWLFNAGSSYRTIWPRSAQQWEEVISPSATSDGCWMRDFFSGLRGIVESGVVTWREVEYSTYFWALRFSQYEDVVSSQGIRDSVCALIDWSLRSGRVRTL